MAKRQSGAARAKRRVSITRARLLADAEHAIGQQPEIAGTGARHQRGAALPRLDIEADGAAVGVIHAGIHREGEALALRRENALDAVEPAQHRAALGVVEKQPYVIGLRVGLAERVARPLDLDGPAGGGRGGRHEREEKGKGEAARQRT